MVNKQSLQHCIQTCQTTASEIKSMSSGASGQARQALDQAYQSINDCIKNCQSAMNQG